MNKSKGTAPDFFALLARKAVQAPGLQPRRASRFEDSPAANGPARWGADPAALAEAGEGDGFGALARSASLQQGSRRHEAAAAQAPAPVMPADFGLGSPASPGPAPSELDRARRAVSAQAMDSQASAPQRWQPVAALSRPADPGSAPRLEPRPADDRGQDREAGREATEAQRGSSLAASPLRPLRRAELDRLEPAATADERSAPRGPAQPSLGSLKLQPLDAVQVPRQASMHQLPERREPALAAAAALRAEAPAPQIEIHIGRIEVLPAGAPAPAAQQQANPAHARAPQSLESYLAERRRS